jgi:hypothetical protein
MTSYARPQAATPSAVRPVVRPGSVPPELTGAERRVVLTLRQAARASATESGPLVDALGRYLAASGEAGQGVAVADPAAAPLTGFESSTLQAIASLQSGLLGDAWQAIAAVVGPDGAGAALLALEEATTSLQRDAAPPPRKASPECRRTFVPA